MLYLIRKMNKKTLQLMKKKIILSKNLKIKLNKMENYADKILLLFLDFKAI